VVGAAVSSIFAKLFTTPILKTSVIALIIEEQGWRPCLGIHRQGLTQPI
jgi:hypothetical protein